MKCTNLRWRLHNTSDEWNVQRQCAFFHYVVHSKYIIRSTKRERKNRALSHKHKHQKCGRSAEWIQLLIEWFVVYSFPLKCQNGVSWIARCMECVSLSLLPLTAYHKLSYCFSFSMFVNRHIYSFISSFNSLSVWTEIIEWSSVYVSN